MSLTACRRGQVEGGKTVSRSTRSTFNLPPSTEARRWHEVPMAERVKEAAPLDRTGPMTKMSVSR